MAKKDRNPAAAKASKPRRSKNAAARLDASPDPAPGSHPQPKSPAPAPLNNHVTVHIISVPPAPAGSPASIPLMPVAAAPVAAVPPMAGLPTSAPSQRNATLPGPGFGAAPVVPTAPAALPPARPLTPPAGSAALDPLAPSPVHKSAINLSPMEQMLWAARLQKAQDVVASQMKVKVTGGKLVRRYTAIDHDDGLFEIQTDKGFYVAVLSKTGEFSIYWRHDRKAY